MHHGYGYILRFRQEYRFERKRAEEGSGSSSQNFSSMASKSHRIHKVVVLHKDIQQTFVEPDDALCSSAPSHKDYSSLTCTTTAATCTTKDVCLDMDHDTHKNVTSTCYYASSQDFFDNDSFWSGQITWY